MKEKIGINVLRFYNAFLSIGSFITGIMMIKSEGIFSEYPKEFMGMFFVEGWTVPGIIIGVLFGIGNLIALILSFLKEDSRIWISSCLMGIILIMVTFVQILITGEWYLASVEFIVLGVIQIILSKNVVHVLRKNTLV